jgi:hypothetical protein
MTGERRGPADLPDKPHGPVVPSRDPRYPGGNKQSSNIGRESMAYLHSGHIVHVDTENMVCSVRLDSMNGERHDVPIPASAGGGPRSFAGLIPEQFSKVIVGFKRGDSQSRSFTPYILNFFAPSSSMARDFEPFSSTDPSDAAAALQSDPTLANDPRINLGVIRLKSRKGYSGDYVASSSSGADLILDRDVFFTNRAGNEFRLRDSDQTSILQTRNEFVANAAGYYRRGLIKRNAFAFLPDLYPLNASGQPTTVTNAQGQPAVLIAPGVSGTLDVNGEPIDRNPAYDTLLGFGLINADGSLAFSDQITPAGYYINPENTSPGPLGPSQINIPSTNSLLSSIPPKTPATMPADTNTLVFYPPVVMPDGHHVSYITQGEPSESFASSLLAYTEDRLEMQHYSDGTMAVTEEGDGFQIDPVAPVYIEDVKGTVVGNDFYTASGRPLYKRILGMRLFSSGDQATPSTGPIFEPIDPVQRLGLFDALGLARLFRMQSPYQGSSNQYVFGLTKEGKVLCHIPKTQAGEPHEKGKSVDLNVLGLIKAIIGSDENSSNTSIDLRTTGGINLDIGRFTGGTNSGASIVINLQGGIVKNHNADPNSGVAQDERYLGSILEAGTATKMVTWGGNIIHNAGGELGNSGQKITNNAGPGGQADNCLGDKGTTVLGKTQEQFGQLVQSIYALGKTRITVSGVDTSTILAGGFLRTVIGGTGISDTVTAGNMTHVVATGNLLQSVATGNFSVTVGLGSLSLASPAGPISLTSTLAATITSGVLTSIVSPVTQIGLATGFAVAGIPGPPGPFLDYIIGIPVLGVPTIAIG